jgi:predicted DNA-binding protein
MPTVTLKLPSEEFQRLETEAKKRGTSKSAVLRQALRASFQKNASESIADRMRDLIGASEGPEDLSTNSDYLEAYGDSDRR